MAQDITRYKLLISCPGDIKTEIDIIKSAVEEFNDLYSDALGIIIQVKHWVNSSYSQSGDKPQALLNKQFVNDSDAAVAIFWTRFGSPTDEYGSGTEEEIETMIKSGKQVFMYFSDKPVPPSEKDDEGYKKVKNFQNKYKDKGLYFKYSSDEEFKKMFFAHLSMYFLSEKKVKDTTTENHSELKLIGIDEHGELCEKAPIQKFIFNTPQNMHQYIETIRSMYHEIANFNVGKRTPTVGYELFFKSSVEIDDKEREYLSAVAKNFELELPDDFFDLGNLNESTASNLSGFSGKNLEGTDDEIRKYWLIKELHATILNAVEWKPIEKAFSTQKCLKIALQNCGKAIDEDVEISLQIPKDVLLTTKEFPQLSENDMKYLITDFDMNALFGIDSTAEFVQYSMSEQNQNNGNRVYPYGLPGYTPDYLSDYVEKLNDVFCYDIFPSNDNYILKLKVDYIKHHTTIAFPTVLFLKDDISEIPYKIISKNNPDIFEGILKIR